MVTITCNLCNKKINAPNPDGEPEHFWTHNVNSSGESSVTQFHFHDNCHENLMTWIETYVAG